MAAFKLKSVGDSSKLEEVAKPVLNSKLLSFNLLDASIVILSMATFIVDLSTDVILVVNYFNNGHTFWAVSTLLLILLPAIIVQMFSIRWYKADDTSDQYRWIYHIFLLGIVHRYLLVLKTGFEARRSNDAVDYQRLFHQQSDICMLHLFESFMESAPQLVLQLYIIITMEDWYSWTALSAVASLGSLAWAVAAYTRAMRRTRPDKLCLSWPGFVLQATWRGGMLTARIAALVIFALGFQSWIFLLLGFHWLVMTIWVIYQETDFCETRWEERVYNCVVGIIYCFCFFNLQEGRSRNRALTFYAIMIVQNMACLGLFISVAGITRPGIVQIAIVTIVGGTVLGITSMLLYYRFFHPAGPIPPWTIKCDVEHSLPPTEIDKYATLRSLKHHCPKDVSITKSDGLNSQESSPHSEVCADKKLLLTNWTLCQTALSNFNSDCELIDEDMDGVEIEELNATIDLSTEGVNLSGESMRLKRRGICSPAEIVQKLDADKKELRDEMCQNSIDVLKSKRRAISSLEPQMEVELELDRDEIDAQYNNIECNEGMLKLNHRNSSSEVNRSVVKSNECSYNEEKDLNESCDSAGDQTEVSVSDSESQYVKETETDSDDAKLKLRAAAENDAPSEVMSMHDYENICAVNIARETWGLRSWQGYSDIETWLHDDSVVRDRRRDTLSTVTSASSERSAAGSPPPLPCRRPAPPHRSRQDDYIDTLVDDLADCLAEPDFDTGANVFVARPYVIDQHGVFFPLTTLDTIEEEAEETSSDTLRHSSASTLVATIDEIRSRGSLCVIYNSQEDLWTNSSEEAATEQTMYASPPASSLLIAAHSRSHLSPEEVLFLSQLQATPDLDMDVVLNATFIPVTQPCQLGMYTGNSVPHLTSDKAKNSPNCPAVLQCCEVGGKKQSKPRRKVSFLREKFEMKKSDHFEYSSDDSSLTAVYSEASIHGSKVNILESVLHEDQPTVYYNKENVLPAVTSRISQWNSILKKPNSTFSISHNLESSHVKSVPAPVTVDHMNNSKPNFSNLKERRDTFFKQVLSPPKFQQWVKKATLSPKSKIVPAS